MSTTTTSPERVISADKIMQVGMSFWSSKVLLSALKMELFTVLGDYEKSGEELATLLQLHERSRYDFLDTLVSLGFLNRYGLKETAVYSNTHETSLFLDKNKETYIGGLLEMCNDRLYKFWGDLEEGLKSGLPQNEVKTIGKPVFESIYADPKRLRLFLSAMAGVQMRSFIALSKLFDFRKYNSVLDLGGANGLLSVCIAKEHPHLSCTSADLPPVQPVAQENIENWGLKDRIHVTNIDLFSNEGYPKSDIITLGNILHDWNLEDKKTIIRKAYDSLSPNGALIVIENIIDDERRTNTFGLLMSLNMLIETTGGFDYSLADFTKWGSEAGFSKFVKIPLAGPTSAIVAYK